MYHSTLMGFALIQHLARARQLPLRKNLRNQFSFVENVKVHFPGILDESLKMSSYINGSYEPTKSGLTSYMHITPIVFSLS